MFLYFIQEWFLKKKIDDDVFFYIKLVNIDKFIYIFAKNYIKMKDLQK